MSWKNFKKEKPNVGKRIVVRDFQTLITEEHNDTVNVHRIILDSGVGVYNGKQKGCLFGSTYSISMILSDGKDLCYILNTKGSQYRKAVKDDADFEWMYI